jgi:hypothetical protein
MNAPQEPAHPIRRFIGIALIALGILWMLATGLCSGGMLLMMLLENPHLQEILSIMPMILLVGGFSVGIGFVLYSVGQALRPKP